MKTAEMQRYFDDIKEKNKSESTESTFRSILEELLNKLAVDFDVPIMVIQEPPQDKSGLGAPDYKLMQLESVLGYVETKQLGTDLEPVLKSGQIKKYCELSNNLILTNYLRFIWIKDGEVNGSETLCDLDDLQSNRKPVSEKTSAVCSLLESFLSVPPTGLGDPHKLAMALAVRCNGLREFLTDALNKQETTGQDRRKLYGLYQAFKSNVSQEITTEEFADAFAQTLGYGLFLAKLNAEDKPLDLVNAKTFIPNNFSLVQELMGFLEVLNLEIYRKIKWLVEEILSIMNSLDLDKLHKSLSFDDAKDPYIYFYEDFLSVYDPSTRKGRGVYYTPPAVVSFIVRAIDNILRDVFQIERGLAKHDGVTVLDFATGTGTFLLEIVRKILDSADAGQREQVISDHILKNLYGFEYLIAPYTIAHLKLSQFLMDSDYKMGAKERLQIYLTNTLESVDPQGDMLLPALTDEVEAAQSIKDKSILVIIGNPPYSGHSKNNGEWIRQLIETYKEGFDDLNKPGQGKWLQDDYVKFMRFAQWKMDSVTEGVVGVITNHSFLDNPTFKGMRRSLMRTFDQMYFLDLHGNSLKKETAPDGGKDENVFDIQQGVCISLMIKRPGLEKGIYHADLWGDRQDKYDTLTECNMSDINWRKITSQSRFCLFTPRDVLLEEQYYNFPSLPEIFGMNGDPAPGIVTTHDEFAVSFTKEEAAGKVEKLLATKNEIEARAHFRLCSQKQWDYEKAKAALKEGQWQEKIVPVLYRPFDLRYTVFDSHVAVHRRLRVMRHMLAGNNLGLTVTRQVKTGQSWQHCLITNTIVESTYVSNRTSEIGYLFPLYIYPDADSFEDKPSENITMAFRQFLDSHYEKHYTSEIILGYIYAVLHCPTYRQRYFEFLKSDFPRIPLVKEKTDFEELAAMGRKLLNIHTFRSQRLPADPSVTFPQSGDCVVQRPSYDADADYLYINKTQYFTGVSPAVWAFRVGGYQVLDKYLKSRKNRPLSLDEIEHIKRVVKTLALTDVLMGEIDAKLGGLLESV